MNDETNPESVDGLQQLQERIADERRERSELEAELEQHRRELIDVANYAHETESRSESAHRKLEELQRASSPSPSSRGFSGHTIALLVTIVVIAACAAGLIWFQHKYPYRAELIG